MKLQIWSNVSDVVFDSYLLAVKGTKTDHQFDAPTLVALGCAYVFGMSYIWGDWFQTLKWK